MISRRPSHMSTIIVIFETSPSGANEPNGPVMPNPGPPLPSALAATASVSSAAERNVRDRRVDRDHRGAHRPEADVEKDEGGDRAQRPLVDRGTVETDRHHDLRADGLAELAPEHLADQEVTHDLDRPGRGARRPTHEHQGEEREQRDDGPECEIGRREPGRRDDRDRLEDRRSDCLLALGDPVPPELDEERDRRADDDHRRTAGAPRRARTRAAGGGRAHGRGARSSCPRGT